MTTSGEEGRDALGRLVAPRPLASTAASAATRHERDLRLRRFLVVGALASFLSVFGITVVAGQTAGHSSSGSVIASRGDDDHGPALFSLPGTSTSGAQIRTRTS